jgi:hypothetical protein
MSLLVAGAALVAILFSLLAMASQAYAQGGVAGSAVTTLQFGPEVWIAVISVLISVGVSIEQLRRARNDIREGVGKISKLDGKIDSHRDQMEQRFGRLPDEFVRRDFWLAKMQSIEDEQKAARASAERIERRIDTLLLGAKPQ